MVVNNGHYGGAMEGQTSGLYRIANFCERHRSEGWTEPSLRWIIFNSATNGLDAAGAVVRQGRRVFIDEPKFFSWLRSSRAPSSRVVEAA